MPHRLGKEPARDNKAYCGLSPWPVATMALDGATLKVYRAEYTDTVTDKAPGSVVSAGKAGLEIALRRRAHGARDGRCVRASGAWRPQPGCWATP